MHMHILTHIDILESGIKYKYCKSYSFRIISHHFMQFHVSYVMHILYTHMNNYIYISAQATLLPNIPYIISRLKPWISIGSMHMHFGVPAW